MSSATTTSTAPHHPGGSRKTLNNNNSRNRPPHPSNPNQPPPNQKKKSNNTNPNNKPKRIGPLDFIDTLDTIGGFHHDGPFDAASSHRNRNLNSKNPSRQAPMAAFDPSALVMPPPPPKSQSASASTSTPLGSNNNPNSHSNEHLYPPPLNRRGSNTTIPVSMGYPAGMIASDPKAARLAEAFGIQDREAWEDFGMQRPMSMPKRSSSCSNGSDSKTSRSERDARTASVWDMEATLKTGKPVPSEERPPLPNNGQIRLNSNNEPEGSQYHFSGAAASSGSPTMKRSKSLMQRIKKGVKSPNPTNESQHNFNQNGYFGEEGEGVMVGGRNGKGSDEDEEEELSENPSGLRSDRNGSGGNGRKFNHQPSKSVEYLSNKDQQRHQQPSNGNSSGGSGGISRKTSLLLRFGLGKSKTINRG